jgi:hypothetical protein
VRYLSRFEAGKISALDCDMKTADIAAMHPLVSRYLEIIHDKNWPLLQEKTYISSITW